MREENGCNTLLSALRMRCRRLQLPENSDTAVRAHLRVSDQFRGGDRGASADVVALLP
jgi:hypothetical protein